MSIVCFGISWMRTTKTHWSAIIGNREPPKDEQETCGTGKKGLTCRSRIEDFVGEASTSSAHPRTQESHSIPLQARRDMVSCIPFHAVPWSRDLGVFCS
jgi:hypothetical protein